MVDNPSSHPSPPTPTAPCPKYLQEVIAEEYQSLLSTLPTNQAWLNTIPLYQYQGFWIHSRPLQGLLRCQHHFRARDTDLLLVTAPKTGTTWLKALVYSLVNRPSCTLGSQDHPLLTTNPHDLVPHLEFKVYADHQVPDLTGLPSPRVLSTHSPFRLLPKSVKETSCKIVYLIRNPKDTFISLLHFVNNLRPENGAKLPLEQAFDLYCKGISVYGPFWDHIIEYRKYSLEMPDKVLFLKYEDLKEQPMVHLKRLAEFCGCPFSVEEEKKGVVDEIVKLCSFENLTNLEVNKSGKRPSGVGNKVFFRKGEVGDWTNYLTPEMNSRIDKIIEDKFHHLGLNF